MCTRARARVVRERAWLLLWMDEALSYLSAFTLPCAASELFQKITAMLGDNHVPIQAGTNFRFSREEYESMFKELFGFDAEQCKEAAEENIALRKELKEEREKRMQALKGTEVSCLP